MPRLTLPLLGIAVALAAPALAQVAPPVADSSGDETSPVLLEMIRQHLAGTSDLRPLDGVFVQESKFFRGTVRIRGTIVSEGQRDSLKRALESIRARLEMRADVKITTFDLSGLRIGPPPESIRSPKDAGAPKTKEAAGEDGEEIIVEEYSGFASPYYFMPPPPPPPPARKRCFFRRHADDDGPGYGPPPYGMYPWWYGMPPMPYGYGGRPYPY
jgi:hypothetical protein